jgi:putative restriction endonuclease
MEDMRQLLTSLRGRYNQRELAQELGVTTRTLRRWEAGETDPPQFLVDALRQRLAPTSPEVRPGRRAFKQSGNWTREQSLLAFRFYCETPFGQLHSRNKKVIELAALIGRTPSALAMKCVNFASLDPAIRESGRSGLSNASALDKEVWMEFHENWDSLIDECEALKTYLLEENGQHSPTGEDADLLVVDFSAETRTTLVKQRTKQAFFRKSVLSSYGAMCCISGVSETRLLVASHIVPWSEDKSNRLNPSNGLCLSAIHDKAFDSHLFSLTNDHRVVLSKQLERTKDEFLRQVFWPTQDRQITLPERFQPNPDLVHRHRERMLAASHS